MPRPTPTPCHVQAAEPGVGYEPTVSQWAQAAANTSGGLRSASASQAAAGTGTTGTSGKGPSVGAFGQAVSAWRGLTGKLFDLEAKITTQARGWGWGVCGGWFGPVSRVVGGGHGPGWARGGPHAARRTPAGPLADPAASPWPAAQANATDNQTTTVKKLRKEVRARPCG
jgi:hypothetical protein